MTGRASKCSIASLTAAVLLAACPASGEAQSFGLAIGSGGHCRHHHCGGWSVGYGFGPWYGPAWYAPPPAVVYAPPPFVQERVIYVQPPPATTPPPPLSPYTSSNSLPSNSSPSNSLASSTAARPSAEDDRIVIHNAAGARLPVSFLVDGQDVELADGATRTFVGKTHRTIQYDRGGRFGSTQQDLAGGQYEFRITATGWDLVRRPKTFSSRTAVRSNTLPDSGVSR
jgi:hypothetical protein